MKRLLALILLPIVAVADPGPHMRKENPDELNTNVSIAGCPVTKQVMQDTVDGVLVRSRIKPLHGELGLGVGLAVVCYKIENFDQYAFMVSVSFIDNMERDGLVFNFRYGYGDVSIVGVGSGEQMIQAAKTLSEEAIADYLRVNFDLGVSND